VNLGQKMGNLTSLISPHKSV